MDGQLYSSIFWWISMIELPALGGLLALVLRMRDKMAAERVESFKNFASVSALKEVESRLVSHLLRIEAKLDTTALKTEALARGGRS